MSYQLSSLEGITGYMTKGTVALEQIVEDFQMSSTPTV